MPLYREFTEFPLVSISDDQRRPLPTPTGWHRARTACRPTCTRSRPAPEGGYLAFLGRISPEKRPDRAIEIAARAGLPLKIAAKVDRVDRPISRR